MWYLLRLITNTIEIGQVQASGESGPNLAILWKRNNWMFPNDVFRVIDSKAVFEDLNLSTEIKFSTDVAQVSTHAAYLYWLVSSNKKVGTYLGSWQMYSNDDTGEGEWYTFAWVSKKGKHYFKYCMRTCWFFITFTKDDFRGHFILVVFACFLT